MKVDLNDPKTRAEYRRLYQRRYAETAGEPELIRKDKASAYAFVALYKRAERAAR